MPLDNHTNVLYKGENSIVDVVAAVDTLSPGTIFKGGSVWGNEVPGTITVVLASMVFLVNMQLAGWFRSLSRHDREQIAALFAENYALVVGWKVSYLVSALGMLCTFLVFFVEGVFFFVVPAFFMTFAMNLYRNKKIFDVVSTRMFEHRRSLGCALMGEGFAYIFLLADVVVLYLSLYREPDSSEKGSPLLIVHAVAIVGDAVAILHALVFEYLVWYRSFVLFFPIVEPSVVFS